MTVKEFIEKLEKLPQDLTVTFPITDSSTSYHREVQITIINDIVFIEGEGI